MATSSYIKQPVADGMQFTVTPAPVPVFITLRVFGVFFAALGVYGIFADGSLNMMSIALIGLGAGGWYAALYDPRPREHRQVSTFTVRASGIQAGSQTVPSDAMHGLLIRNSIDDNPAEPHDTRNNLANAGRGQRMRIRQVAFALVVEHEGRATLLAGGLDDTTARGLEVETRRALGKEVGRLA
jgi:hypothetical protein